METKKLALICACLIFILEIIALWKGFDGTCLSIAVAAIAGLGGYGVRDLIEKKIQQRKGEEK